MSTYFSDRERGSVPRDSEEITIAAWGGFVALLQGLVVNGGFGADYPSECPDGLGTTGTNEHTFELAIGGEIPDIKLPINAGSGLVRLAPKMAILDLLEFCHRDVAEPIQTSNHKVFGHHHLSFDREAGQSAFRLRVNRIFERNGIAFQLTENGQIERMGPPVLRESLTSPEFQTGDATLDDLLNTARSKFLSPDVTLRRESIEKLWDSWERLKTLTPGMDKRDSIAEILDQVASESDFRALLESEAIELTNIGNSFMIRHTETGKTPIESDEQIDYLFHRLFALVLLILRNRS